MERTIQVHDDKLSHVANAVRQGAIQAVLCEVKHLQRLHAVQISRKSTCETVLRYVEDAQVAESTKTLGECA